MNRVVVRSAIMRCTNCALSKSCRAPVPFSGPSPSSIVVIGEAPGQQEDDQGKPFVGPAGQMMRRLLTEANVDVEEVAFVNVVSCFPHRTPTPNEVAACRANLLAQLDIIRPTHALIVGGVAVSAWWDINITSIRGMWWRLDDVPNQPWALATWHPSAVLRNRTLYQEALSDIRAFVRPILLRKEPPLPLHCVKCGSFGDVYRMRDGTDVSGRVSKQWLGALPFCTRHDEQRMGVAGKGRVKAKKAAKKVKPPSQQGTLLGLLDSRRR